VSLTGIEGTCEGVTVIDTEDSSIDVQIHRYGEIGPVDGGGRFAINRDLVALEENSLGESGILLPVLKNMDGVVFQVVEHGALVDTEVLIFRFDDGLLEVGIEAEYLSVVLKPLRGNLRDSVILVFGAHGHAREVGRSTLTHGFEQTCVDWLLECFRLLANGAVFNAKELGLVVPGDRRVRIDVSG